MLEYENNYLPLNEVFVGFNTKQMLKKLFNDGSTDQNEYGKVLNAAVAFYKESMRYLLTKMDMSCSFWQHVTWIDFFCRNKANWYDIEYFLLNFSNILQFDDQEKERLYEEYIDCKTVAICGLPDHALTDAVIQENDVADEYSRDVIWYHLFQIKSPIGNNYRFRLLFNVARLVMVAPHSNAGIERVYALVNKNKSEGSDRSRLDIEGTLPSILAVKLD